MRLLDKIEIYRAARRMSPTRFGRLVARDPRLIADLRRGRRPTARMIRRIESFMARHPA